MTAPTHPEPTVATSAGLDALADGDLWRVLDSARRVPLAALIAEADARRSRQPSELLDAVLDTLHAREARLHGSRRACIERLAHAQPVLERLGARDFAVTACLERSHAEIDWGDYGAAIASLEDAQRLVAVGVDAALTARVKSALGRIYSRIGNHQTAIRLIRAARDEAQAQGMLNLAATWSVNLAVAAMRAWEADRLAGGDSPAFLDQADAFLGEARGFVSMGADDSLLGPLIETNGACVMTFRGRPDLAIPLHAACDDFLRERRLDALICSNRVDWAKALIAARRFAEARELAAWVVARAEEGGQLFALTEAMRLLADLHEAQGDAPAALAALRRHQSLAARVSALEALQRADALQVRIETERVKAEAASALAHNARLQALNTQLSKQEVELRELAERDHLTGAANRRHFEATLDLLLGAPSPRLALGLVDIDHFKAINDRHSHAAGDAVLRVVASVLSQVLRQGDTVARIGGDEFAFIARDVDGRAMHDAAKRIGPALGGAAIPGFPAVGPVTLSIGIAAARQGDERARLVARADRALYAVKRAGRDGVALDPGD